MKGQVKLEFIFGVIMFSIVVFWVVSQINTVYAGVGTDSNNDVLRARAYNLISYIAEGSGDVNWETSNYPGQIGLAYYGEPYSLSDTKIDKLNSNCTILDEKDIGAYRLTIQDDSGEVLFCGSPSVSPTRVSITRSVWLEDHYGNLTVEVW